MKKITLCILVVFLSWIYDGRDKYFSFKRFN